MDTQVYYHEIMDNKLLMIAKGITKVREKFSEYFPNGAVLLGETVIKALINEDPKNCYVYIPPTIEWEPTFDNDESYHQDMRSLYKNGKNSKISILVGKLQPTGILQDDLILSSRGLFLMTTTPLPFLDDNYTLLSCLFQKRLKVLVSNKYDYFYSRIDKYHNDKYVIDEKYTKGNRRILEGDSYKPCLDKYQVISLFSPTQT